MYTCLSLLWAANSQPRATLTQQQDMWLHVYHLCTTATMSCCDTHSCSAARPRVSFSRCPFWPWYFFCQFSVSFWRLISLWDGSRSVPLHMCINHPSAPVPSAAALLCVCFLRSCTARRPQCGLHRFLFSVFQVGTETCVFCWEAEHAGKPCCSTCCLDLSWSFYRNIYTDRERLA